ncbi:molybdopterin-dependent oxidoreductase, partial [Candidatus Zixiibacteriota bacterium]
VLGRFTIPYFLSSRDRLIHPEIEVGGLMREVSWDDAWIQSAEILSPMRGDTFAFVCDQSGTVEDRLAARTFTEEVMGSTYYIEIEDGEDATPVKLPDGIRAVMMTGDFVDEATLAGLDAVVILDCFPTAASSRAAVLLPAAVLLETAGHMVDETGTERPVVKAANAPGKAKQDWEIICGLISAMGDEGRAGKLADEIIARIDGSEAVLLIDREQAPAPALDITKIRSRYRGHVIAERVPPLQEVRTPRGSTTAEALSEVSTCSEC